MASFNGSDTFPAALRHASSETSNAAASRLDLAGDFAQCAVSTLADAGEDGLHLPGDLRRLPHATFGECRPLRPRGIVIKRQHVLCILHLFTVFRYRIMFSSERIRMPSAPDLLEAFDALPELRLVDYGVYRAPTLLGERQYGRAPHAGQNAYGLVEAFLRQVHQHVFHVAAVEYRVETEGELLDFEAFFPVKPRCGDEHGLRKEDLLDLLQPVRDERAARGYDVEDGVGHPHGGGDFD